MVQDYSQIKRFEDLVRLEDEAGLYDESPGFEDDNPYGVELMPGLSEEELEDSMIWMPYTRGVMLVKGPAGSGKGTFANPLAWKMKRYFGKVVFMDYRPRRLFGVYHPFNEAVLVEQLARMSNVATGDVMRADKKELEGMTSEWVSKYGMVLLRNSVLVLDEYKKYHYNRNPNNPMGKVLSQVYDIWRHMDILVIGIAQDKRELDRFSCIPKITFEVRCEWLLASTLDKYGFWPLSCKATIAPMKYVGITGEGILDIAGKPETIVVPGGKPQRSLRAIDVTELGRGYVEGALIKGEGDGQISDEDFALLLGLAKGEMPRYMYRLQTATGIGLDELNARIEGMVNRGYLEITEGRWVDIFNTKDPKAIEPPASIIRRVRRSNENQRMDA
jgi:hypothetical protein